MRIGFDAKRAYQNATGLGNYSRTIIRGLLRYYPSHQYLLAAPHPSRFPDFAFPTLSKGGTEGLAGISPHIYTILPPHCVPSALWRTFALGHVMRRHGADLFHGLSHELPVDIGSTPSIVTMHDVAFKAFPSMYSPIDRAIYDTKWRFACRQATHIVAISESTRRDVQHYYNVPDERISVICQPVQDLFYTPLPPERAEAILKADLPLLPAEYLLSVGSVNSRKNLLGTLQAYATLPSENRPPLVVVGNGGSYMAQCKAYAAKHFAPSDIVWLHHLGSNLTLQALYNRALALLYPSHYEGMGLPVIEALLQHCPVLTSNLSSLPQAAGPGALLVNPSDADAMSYSLHRLVDDSQLRHTLGEEGQRYTMEHFAPDVLMAQMIQLYRQVTGH